MFLWRLKLPSGAWPSGMVASVSMILPRRVAEKGAYGFEIA
jgi:hypothetical protein